MKSFKRALFVIAVIFCSVAHATVVEFRTILGDFQVNLFDESTPATVQNFLDYTNSGAYASTIVHRSVPGFVVQGGGFVFNGPLAPNVIPDAVVEAPPVNNEPVLSNVRGTISMAKIAGNPNSATSQWFINLENNSANLDVSNGGFTVFGQVLGDGMQVVDAIADLQRFGFASPLNELPLRDYTAADANAGVDLTEDNFVVVTDVVVVDATVVTNPNIDPVRNTLLDASTPNEPIPSVGDGSSGGSLNLSLIALLSLLFAVRTQVRR